MNSERFQALVGNMLPVAEKLLGQHRSFVPFAGLIAKDGTLSLATGEEAQGHDPTVIRDSLFRALKVEAAEAGHVATCVCIDVTFEDPRSGHDTDAVLFCLEQMEGEAVHLFLPYEQHPSGSLEYGDLLAVPGDHLVFPVSGDAA